MNIPYGNNLKLTVEGGSHDEFIALELKNFPAGFRPDYEELLSFMQRRAPGRSAYSRQGANRTDRNLSPD